MPLFLATFPSDVMSVGNARHAVEEALGEAHLEAFQDSARLVVDELVWNVVLHAGTAAVVRIKTDGDALMIEVGDGSREPPAHRAAGPDDIAGRGLAIVDELAHSWGWDEFEDGKVVWARLAEPDAGADPGPDPGPEG